MKILKDIKRIQNLATSINVGIRTIIKHTKYN